MGNVKKFELTSNFITTAFGKKLFRIKALISFANIEAGEMGGYLEKEENLDQSGDAWVSGNARVYGDAVVYGYAEVSGNAEVSGDAVVYGDADYACVKGFGTAHRNTTFFREKDGGVKVNCGCFYGDIESFRKQVEQTRTGKIAKEYLMIADLMELHFKKED